MAATEGSRKLLCAFGKPLAVFDAKGLNLYCRFSKGDDDGAVRHRRAPAGRRVRREAAAGDPHGGAGKPRCQEEWTLTE